ncbi:RNA-binding protein [Schizosaccharomyces japonicus yFS275]|uniref:RNA-binding protein n=1 Tax=Schizosaccharomyces japonicus (strain yFS275 / FY16936) TaxID=402676 RepID=B6JXA2_SCHJY|nr:RNA-binding protein [Schizosaccharomyces japonicus yFS275]EEB06003.1 RNA-binding protein [Schizosaccharomyces japonicus yFS275]
MTEEKEIQAPSTVNVDIQTVENVTKDVESNVEKVSEKQSSEKDAKTGVSTASENTIESKNEPESAAATTAVDSQENSAASSVSGSETSEAVKNVWRLRQEKMQGKGASRNESKPHGQLKLQDQNVWPSPDAVEKKAVGNATDDVQKPLAPKTSGKEKWVAITPNITHTPIGFRKRGGFNRHNHEFGRRGGFNRRKGGSDYRRNGNRGGYGSKPNNTVAATEAAGDSNATTEAESTSADTSAPNATSAEPSTSQTSAAETNSTSRTSSPASNQQSYPHHHPEGRYENRRGDIYLRKHMDAEGYVPLFFLANFNRLKNLTTDINAIRAACVASSVVEVQANDESPYLSRVRKAESWKNWVMPESMREIPVPPAASSQAASSSDKPASTDEATVTEGVQKLKLEAPVFSPQQGVSN